MIPFSFQKGNKATGCEDAPPVAEPVYTVVCDGLGGAGATKHTVVENEGEAPVTRTSGYLGSRIVCNCVNEYYAEYVAELTKAVIVAEKPELRISLVNGFLEGLKKKIVAAFDEKMQTWGIEASRSKTLKDFPTTLASAIYIPHSDGITVLTVWAGDSRVYVLEPDKGLRLLSLDDAKNAENEMNSTSEMTNCISAGNAFRLNYTLYEFKEPGIIFCCSDGCFDYVQSPLHLEWLLLHTILECMPYGSDSDLGNVLADSIRDNMYKTIGDDTTMAGVIAGIETVLQMKDTYRKRMTDFGELAINMNEHLRELRKIQSDKDSAQKTCRLYEGKIISSIYSEACRALKPGNEKSILYSKIASLPCYSDIAQIKGRINSEIADQCDAEIHKLQEEAAQAKKICRNMLLCDYTKWYKQNEEQSKSLSRIQTALSSKSKASNSQPYAELQMAKQILLTCKELYMHPYFSELASLPPLQEEEMNRYILSQIGTIEALISVIDNADPLFLNMWSQAYFSTENYTKDRKDNEMSPQFEFVLDQAMTDPTSCKFVSALSAKKVEEYRKINNGIEAITEKYRQEKQRRMEGVADAFWREHQDDILNMLMSENEVTLQTMFSNSSTLMDKLLSFVQAKRTLNGISLKIAASQTEVDKIWEQYKGDYQLVSMIAEKGAC